MEALPNNYLNNHLPYLLQPSWADIMEHNRSQAKRLISKCYNIPVMELHKRVWCFQIAVLPWTMKVLTEHQFGMLSKADLDIFFDEIVMTYKDHQDEWWSQLNAEEIEAGKTRFQRQGQD